MREISGFRIVFETAIFGTVIFAAAFHVTVCSYSTLLAVFSAKH